MRPFEGLTSRRVIREVGRRVHNEALDLGDALLHRRAAHFLHVGKTGGTAITTALDRSAHSLRAGRFRIRLHGHETTLPDIPVGEAVFFVVRDPVTRFVSAFNSRLRGGRPRYDVPWNPHEEDVFARFTSPGALAEALTSSDDATRNAAESAMRTITHVKRSYWDWFIDERYFADRANDVLFVLFQEQLNRDFATLADLLGLRGRIDLPHDEVAAHRTPAGFVQGLSSPAIENLRRWYPRDINFVALCRELRRSRCELPN